MTFKELCAQLGVNHSVGHNYRINLKKREMVDPKKAGTKDVYSEEDVAIFRKLHQLLQEGCQTVPEAIRMMQEKVSPAEALEAHRRSQRQIEQMSKKIVELKKPSFWAKMSKWFGKLKFFRKKVDGKTQGT